MILTSTGARVFWNQNQKTIGCKDMRRSYVLLVFRTLLLLACLLKHVKTKQFYSGHKVIRVVPEKQTHLNLVASLQSRFSSDQVEIWKMPSSERVAIDIRLSPENDYNNVTALLKSHDIDFKVQIPDLQTAIEEQNGNSRKKRMVTSWFERYHPLDEIFSQLRQIAGKYKRRVRMFSVGESYGGRQLFAVEIKANQKITKPLVFINCGIHAREWVSPATCMYVIKQLASESPANDVSVRKVLNKVDVVVLPVFNVDGYVYTWEKDRMWRKNRSPNPDVKCVGTDLNRNWGFHWGEKGASSNPCSENYRGKASVSEIEVQSVSNFLESQKERLVGYLDIHSYSQMVMFPWGYTKEHTEDHNELMQVAMAMANAIKTRGGHNTNYTFGQASHIIYTESGTTKDYVYGHLNVKYTFSMELRDTGKYGFLLPRRLIKPTAKEAFEGIKAMIENMKLDH